MQPGGVVLLQHGIRAERREDARLADAVFEVACRRRRRSRSRAPRLHGAGVGRRRRRGRRAGRRGSSDRRRWRDGRRRSSARWSRSPPRPWRRRHWRATLRPVFRNSAISSTLQPPRPVRALPVRSGATQLSRSPPCKSCAALVGAEQVLGRVAGAAVAGAFDQIGAPVPFGRLAGGALAVAGVKEEQVPALHHEADVERERQLVGGRCVAHRRGGLQ